MKGGSENKEPVWSERGITYEYADKNKKELNVTVPVNDKLRNNKTLYLHFQLTVKNPFYVKGLNDKDYGDRHTIDEDTTGDFDEHGIQKPTKKAADKEIKSYIKHQVQPQFLKFNETISLIKHMPKIKESVKRNLLSDEVKPEIKYSKDEDEVLDDKYYPYFKKELYLYVVHDPHTYQPSQIPEPIAKKLRIDYEVMHYQPIIYLSDYWLLKRDMVMVNETVGELNMTLHFDIFSLNYMIMQR